MRKYIRIKAALLLFAIAFSFAFVTADMSATAAPCGPPCCGVDCGGGVMAIGQWVGGQCLLNGGQCVWGWPKGPCDDCATGCP